MVFYVYSRNKMVLKTILTPRQKNDFSDVMPFYVSRTHRNMVFERLFSFLMIFVKISKKVA